MNDTVITIKTETSLKNEAMKVAEELGFSLSSLVNAYLKSFVRTKAVNFSLEDESQPTKFMVDSLRKSKEDIRAGRVMSFNTQGEELDYLNKLIEEDENGVFKKIRKAVKESSGKHQKTISTKASCFSAGSI